MMKLALTRTLERRDWTLLAGMGFLVPAILSLFRVFVLRHTNLGSLGVGFVPLAGPMGGIWPHSLYLAMHDLTHPLLLIVYAAVFAWLPLYFRARVSTRWCSLAAFLGVLIVHCAFFLSYFGSLFLPVGDMVTTIKQ